MHTYSIDSGKPPGLSAASIGTVVVFVVLLLVAFVSWLRVKFPARRSPRK